ncbi:MAG: heavy metal translocating P-type ATPase [bacterium]
MKTVPCAHCGQKTTSDADPAFCCSGCETVYHTIHSAGFAQYYELGRGERAPSAVKTDAAFDSDTFKDSIRTLPDGTCEAALFVDGVHCAACVWLVERMPTAVEGVVESRLNMSRGRLELRWQPDKVSVPDMAVWLTQFGYSAHPLHRADAARGTAERQSLFRIGVAWTVAMNVMLMAVALYSGLDTSLETGLATAARWASMGLAAISVFWAGSEFYRRAWASMRPFRGLQHLSIDVPITIGIWAGFLHSVWATVSGNGEVWFDSISVLIAALLSARWLQRRGTRMATESAQRLLALLPSTARRVDGDEVIEVPVASLAAGHVVEVRAGDVVPADGIVVQGHSALHRAVITGESRPEDVTEGSLVSAGETNVSAPILLRVTAAGPESRLGKILSWVESATVRRAPVVQKADWLSGWFVLAVLLASLITFIAWSFIDTGLALEHTIALLVISCPCALGMATPLALTVAMGRAARKGIFIKYDDVLERMEQVDVVVFDKTGTLTHGVLEVAAVVGAREAVLMAAAVEAQSTHPVARALVSYAQSSGQGAERAQDVTEVAGSGMSGIVKGRFVEVGRPAWLGVDEAELAPFVANGQSPVAIRIDGEVVALLGVGDVIRDESASVLNVLRARGARPVILSGDHPEVAASVGATLGFAAADVMGGQSPEQKLAYIEHLREQGHVVAMIGDGVNDAASLSAADVGIAIQGGTDLNLVAADVFLTRSGLEPLQHLFGVSDAALQTVRRNLGISLIYNVITITLAALGFVTPLLAAVLMPISSLVVVFSSLVQRSATRPEAKRTTHAHNVPVSARAATQE